MYADLKIIYSNVLNLYFVCLQIFDKALEEPKYSTVYAQLCKRLDEDAPSFEPPGSNGRVRLGLTSLRPL